MCVSPAALSVCPDERSGASAVLQPGEAAGEGGGGGLAVEPLQGSFLAAASPKPLPVQRGSAPLATYRRAPLLGSRRACGTVSEAPRSKCALRRAVPSGAEAAGQWLPAPLSRRGAECWTRGRGGLRAGRCTAEGD